VAPRPCENRPSARRPRAAFPPRAAALASPGRPRHDQIRIMDIERINAIGNHIADLTERTTALRGYL
jgi:hypothetical protein